MQHILIAWQDTFRTIGAIDVGNYLLFSGNIIHSRPIYVFVETLTLDSDYGRNSRYKGRGQSS